jgi:hypothetical protein
VDCWTKLGSSLSVLSSSRCGVDLSVFGSDLVNGQLLVAGYTRIGCEMSSNSAVAIGGPLSAAARRAQQFIWRKSLTLGRNCFCKRRFKLIHLYLLYNLRFKNGERSFAIYYLLFDNGLEFRQSFWCFNPGEGFLVLTVQFSQSTISCVSWGVKENPQRYSGIAEYPIDLYSGLAEYPNDL